MEDAQKLTEKLGSSIKNGLATAAKIGTAAISTAATGIAALTKASVDGYAEYEQLVGGLELMLGNAYGSVAENAKNAFKTMGLSANEYMQQASQYATGLLNAIGTVTEQATGAVTEATIGSLNKQLDAMQATQDKNVEAVKNANEKEIELLEEAYEKELADFEKLTDERIKLIDKQYAENMKLVDEEEYRRLQAVQAEIDAINAEQAADDKAAKQREENEKKAALQEKINTAETAEERKKAQEEYNKYLDELRQEQIEADRKARISNLKAEKDAIKEEADAKRDELKKQRDNDVKVIQESAAVELQERKKGQAAQLKALKESQAAELKALKDSNKQKLDAMRDYIAEQKKLVTDGTTQTRIITDETRQQVAELTDRILTAQADVVAATGQSQEAVQNAFSGLMRSEYTLLDNLRLGITPTKEGFQDLIDTVNEWNAAEGNATNYVIDNLADAQNALVDYIAMQEMSGYAAAEAGTTISGALAAAGAAWSNLVTGISDGNADISQLIDNFVTTITGDGSDTNLGVFGTLIPTVEKAINGVGEVISKLLPVALGKMPDLIQNTIPNLIKSAASLVKAIGQGILDNVGLLTETAISLVTDLGGFIIEGLPEIVKAAVKIVGTIANGIVSALPELIPTITDLVLEIVDILTNEENIKSMIDGALELILALGEGLINAVPKIYTKVYDVVFNIVSALLEKTPDIVNAGVDLISHLWDNLPLMITTMETSVKEYIEGIVDKLVNYDWAGVGQKMLDKLKEAFTSGWNVWEDFGGDLFEKMHPEEEKEPSSGGGLRTGGSSAGGRREPSIVQNNYFTAPYDANEQSKADEKLLNTLAFGQ